MTLDEAIKVLRQHNEKGASVLRITQGQALEKDLLAQVLDSCEQLISEKAEYKRLLKAAVEDFTAIAEVHAAATPILCPQYGKYMKAIDVRTRKWRYADEALALIKEDGDADG